MKMKAKHNDKLIHIKESLRHESDEEPSYELQQTCFEILSHIQEEGAQIHEPSPLSNRSSCLYLI